MRDNGSGATTACARRDGGGIDHALADELGVTFPDAHFKPAALARLSSETARRNGVPLAGLPFCCTIEAEAMGAHIRLGNARVGPRPDTFAFQSLDELLAAGRRMNFDSRRLAAVLEACRILSAGGDSVMVEISGPLAILGSLMELGKVFKAWRKDAGSLVRVFDILQKDLLEYARRVTDTGAKMVSFADPVAGGNVLGPNYSRTYAELFLSPFMRRLVGQARDRIVHLCPGNTRLLVDCGLVEWDSVWLDAGLPYQAGCLTVSGRPGFLGETCIKDSGRVPGNGRIRMLRPRGPEVA